MLSLRTLLVAGAATAVVACSSGGKAPLSPTPTLTATVSTPTPTPGVSKTPTLESTRAPTSTPTPVPAHPETATPAPTITATPQVTSGPSGIEGTVLLGPMCPVVQAESPCPDRPIRATVIVWDSEPSRKVTTFTSSEDGQFRIELRPGDYYLDPQPLEPDSPLPAGAAQSVTVLTGEFTAITIQYDTGIR
jgi:hypothetical protein